MARRAKPVGGVRAVRRFSGDSFKKLREDGEFIVSRGKREADGLAVLLLAPVPGPRLATSLGRLEQACSLRDELDSAWAARPLEMVEFHDRPALLTEDPGG